MNSITLIEIDHWRFSTTESAGGAKAKGDPGIELAASVVSCARRLEKRTHSIVVDLPEHAKKGIRITDGETRSATAK